jgi:hypothetical protein
MRRFGMALVLAVIVLALASPVVSATAPPARPEHGTFHTTGTVLDSGLPCSSPVAVSFEVWYTYTDDFLKDGTIKEVGRMKELDTYTANGKSVGGSTNVSYTTVYSGDWTTVYSDVVHGVLIRVKLPDGTEIVGVGRADVTNVPTWWNPDTGRAPDLAALCAYFFD